MQPLVRNFTIKESKLKKLQLVLMRNNDEWGDIWCHTHAGTTSPVIVNLERAGS